MRALDPQASPAALLGAEIRELRLRHELSLAALGRLVHVSGDLIGKIEKADRRPQPDLVERLDGALDAGGRLSRLARDVLEDTLLANAVPVAMTTDTARSSLRDVIDVARCGDHAMNGAIDPTMLIAHARAAEDLHGATQRAERRPLCRSIAEAYQLAGWMYFDQGRPARAEQVLGLSRDWVQRADDHALAAFVLGPNLSFVATYGGDPALGVERAYGAVGWARRSGNRRLTAFTMAIGARAHARLREPRLCLDLLDQAENELDRHMPGEYDGGWLSVFDHAALDGHRGSCLLDLGRPAEAVERLTRQDHGAAHRFVRNRLIWHLDQVDALLDLHEIDQACTELASSAALLPAATPRVQRRFRAIGLRLANLPVTAPVVEATELLNSLTEANA